MSGYFLLYRELFEKQWYVDLGQRRHIVFHILARAGWKNNRLADGRELEPGQLVLGLEEFAKECAVSIKQVRTTLATLEKVEFVARERARKGARNGTLLTVINWDTYQLCEDDEGKQKGRVKGKRGATKNKGNKEYITNDFERLWMMYPRREGKKQAAKHFAASVKTESDLMAIEKAIKNYLAHLKAENTPPKFIKQGSTFFNNWQDWLATPTDTTTASDLDRLVEETRKKLGM